MAAETGRVSRDELQKVFEKYAVFDEKQQQSFIGGRDFFTKFVGLDVGNDADARTLQFLTGIVDTTKNGLISFDEFCAFEKLLTLPDAIYVIAFRLFDSDGSGTVSFEEFKQVYCKTLVHERIPFNFNCEFVKLHFGSDRKKELSYAEFTQFLQSVQEEHAKQAFSSRDQNKDGFITPLDLKEIMSLIRTHILTPYVADNLVAITRGHKVSYTVFEALNQLLSNAEVFRKIFDEVNNSNSARSIASSSVVMKEEFLHAAQSYPQVTPLEIEILFQFAALNHQNGFVNKGDFELIVPTESAVQVYEFEEKISKNEYSRGPLLALAESAYRFGLGSIAGATGAAAVYPIDLVKTRMQNQRITLDGNVMYKHSFDCFKKVIQFEGVMGLYRGLLPQLMGVAPEKAIKLTVNDFVRDHLTTHDGRLPLWGEIMAGGMAGGCQVLFTNPLEIVKIRLQTAGENASTKGARAGSVIRELGLVGLYKGARACLLRDIPFSAIYFPLYAHLKKSLQDADGRNSLGSLFCAGVGAGIPAPFFTTPCDVIKTRLQVKAREGQTTYNGVIDCARKISREEGFSAFWKGSIARVFRSAPQFGVTLVTYEALQRALPVDFAGSRPEGSTKRERVPEVVNQLPALNSDHIGGLRTTVAAFAGMESKFGLFLPKFTNPLHNKIFAKGGSF